MSASQCGLLGVFSSGCVNLDINCIILLLPVHHSFVTFSRVIIHTQINVFYLLFFNGVLKFLVSILMFQNLLCNVLWTCDLIK